MTRLLFVCSGNICRSPMAAAYARHRAAQQGLELEVDSCGLLGIERQPPTPEAIHVLREEAGIDLSPHRSRGLRPLDVPDADRIVVMTIGHLAELTRRQHAAAEKSMLIRAWEAGAVPARMGVPDLPDPIGQPLETYRRCFAVIRPCVEHLLQDLSGRA